MASEEEFDPLAVGDEGPPVGEKPYRVLFDASGCIGAGRCAMASDNWELDLSTGIANPASYYLDEDDLEENLDAAERCPAKSGRGVIHVVDRRTGEEVAPDPHGDGTISIDW